VKSQSETMNMSFATGDRNDQISYLTLARGKPQTRYVYIMAYL
jgi:hypothetical protein